MSYTIIAAKYANPDHTSAEITTVEAGSVAASEVDRPELWKAMLEWGEPDPYAAPEEPANA